MDDISRNLQNLEDMSNELIRAMNSNETISTDQNASQSIDGNKQNATKKNGSNGIRRHTLASEHIKLKNVDFNNQNLLVNMQN